MEMEVKWDPVQIRAQNGMFSITARLRQPQGLVLQNIADVADFPDYFAEMIEDVLDEAVTRMDLEGTDRIGLTIIGRDSDGNSNTIGIGYQTVDQMNAEHILQQIVNVLPSSLSIAMTMTIRFTGIMTDLEDVGGNNDHRILDRISGGRRCITQIHPPNDPHSKEQECLFQFMALGMAYLLKKNVEFPDDVLESLNRLGINTTTYSLCVSGRGRFNVRHDLALRLKALLPEEFVDQSVMWKLAFYEEIFKVHFVIYDVVNRFRTFYPSYSELPRFGDDLGREIYGVLERGNLNHIDLCLKPSALAEGTEAGRVCLHCYELFTRSRVCTSEECKTNSHVNCKKCHTCIGFCSGCCTQDCGKFFDTVQVEDDEYEDLKPFTNGRYCNQCHVGLYSKKCEVFHAEVCDEIKGKRCEHCGKADHRGLKCDEIRCLMCSEKMNKTLQPDHVCWMRREKLKKPKTCYWTYDFEACLDEEKRHVIYLATAWPIYPVTWHPRMGEYETFNLEAYPEQPVFVFWGLEGVKKLFMFFMEEFVHGCEFFAHNAGKYDAVFIEKYMSEMHGALPQKLQRGTKIMQMIYSENNITFKDSLCFIASTLRAMSSNFGIEELRKGFFPHKLMTVEYLRNAELNNFQVQRPSIDVWESDFRRGKEGQAEKRELDTFLETFYATGGTWDLRKDAVEYCISDTVLLGQVLKLFRERCMSLAEDIELDTAANPRENQIFDVLQYVTLPSAVMNLFMSRSLPQRTLAVVDRYPCLMRKQGMLWVVYESARRSFSMDSVRMFPTVRDVPVTAVTDQFLFLFLPCYDHGCPKCYPTQHRNVRKDMTFYKLYDTMTHASALLKVWCAENNRLFIHMWEHDWVKVTQKKNFRSWQHEQSDFITDYLPIDPREAYKGGMSEMYKIFHPEAFSMSDFVSQYPTTMLGFSFSPTTSERVEWELPTGKPEITMYPDADIVARTRKLGIVKCRIVPPPRLYAPFLGYKAESRIVQNSYEVIYGLCRVCMENRVDRSCDHNDDERSFTGTWTISEVKYALTLGYRIQFVTEIWEYSGKSHLIFKDFIVPFIKAKILAKKDGIVNEDGTFTVEGEQVAHYLFQMTGKRVLPEEFKDAPVDRSTTKVMINSVYGKFGQRSVWPSSASFTESDEDIKKCDILLQDSSIQLQSFDLIPRLREDGTREMIAIVSYEKNYPASRGDAKKHDLIAAHITAYGRQMLNQGLQLLGDKAIYSDTDSIAHTRMHVLPYKIGFRIGDLELELAEAIMWVANGRKSYMYLKTDGTTVCKQKGVSLKVSMDAVFTVENMLDMIVDTAMIVDSLTEEGLTHGEALAQLRKMDKLQERPSLDVDQMMFVTKRNALSGEKFTRHGLKKTRFLIEAMKRRIVPLENMIDTLPFGYVDE